MKSLAICPPLVFSAKVSELETAITTLRAANKNSSLIKSIDTFIHSRTRFIDSIKNFADNIDRYQGYSSYSYFYNLFHRNTNDFAQGNCETINKNLAECIQSKNELYEYLNGDEGEDIKDILENDFQAILNNLLYIIAVFVRAPENSALRVDTVLRNIFKEKASTEIITRFAEHKMAINIWSENPEVNQNLKNAVNSLKEALLNEDQRIDENRYKMPNKWTTIRL